MPGVRAAFPGILLFGFAQTVGGKAKRLAQRRRSPMPCRIPPYTESSNFHDFQTGRAIVRSTLILIGQLAFKAWGSILRGAGCHCYRGRLAVRASMRTQASSRIPYCRVERLSTQVCMNFRNLTFLFRRAASSPALTSMPRGKPNAAALRKKLRCKSFRMHAARSRSEPKSECRPREPEGRNTT